MRNKKLLIVFFGLILTCLVLVGCKEIFVSGTFVFVETFDGTAQSGFYFRQFDVTEDEDWIDYKDDIDFIDAIGVELFITSTESGDVTFNAYVDDYVLFVTPPTSVPTGIPQIITDLVISPGTTHITYQQSLRFLTNIDEFKALAKLGRFNYFGTSSGSNGSTFMVDSVKIVVTISASE